MKKLSYILSIIFLSAFGLVATSSKAHANGGYTNSYSANFSSNHTTNYGTNYGNSGYHSSMNSFGNSGANNHGFENHPGSPLNFNNNHNPGTHLPINNGVLFLLIAGMAGGIFILRKRKVELNA